MTDILTHSVCQDASLRLIFHRQLPICGLPSSLSQKQALNLPFLAQVFRRPAQSAPAGKMGASWVDSCRGRGQPPHFLLLELHGLALLPAVPLWCILESGAPPGTQDPGSPLRGEFYPEKTESLCNRDGKKGDKKKPWPGKDGESFSLWPLAHCEAELLYTSEC